ncbi:MAG: plasmid pRiA4b ORF-3 family protein [Bacteroidales bacterium]
MVYQILIVLDQITPKIWRRVFVHEDTLLFDFHIIIQIVMGWENCHLHQFIKDGKYYSEKPENDNFWDDSHNVDYTGMTIGDLLKKKGDTIIYEYDFGDSWIHTLTLEAIHNSANTSTQVPLCIAGERPCPDEDSGGPFLYKPPRGKVKKDIGLNAINYMLSDDYYKEKEIKAEMAGPDFSAGESAGSAQGADPATGRYPGKDSGSAQDAGSTQGADSAQGAGSAINADNENFTYKEILLQTKTKAQIVEIARSFKMRIKASANKETCAEFVERELQQNPRLLRNALSYNELRALYLLLKNVKDSKTSRVQVPGGDQSPAQTGAKSLAMTQRKARAQTGAKSLAMTQRKARPQTGAKSLAMTQRKARTMSRSSL